MNSAKKILIVDAFSETTNDFLRESIGEESFGAINGSILDDLYGDAIEWDVAYGLREVPDVDRVARYDGSIWTGSSLSATDESEDVQRMQDWMPACVAAGKPIFGICFGLQIAAKLGGGEVEPNPLGLETIVGRKVTTTPEGAAHPMMQQRSGAFDVVADHVDNIVSLPPGGQILASNTLSEIQAAAFEINGTPVWGVQYHPDMDTRFLRLLLIYRRDQLIENGTFKDAKDYDAYFENVERFLENPENAELATQLNFGRDVMETAPRVAELQCWIEHQILRPGEV